MAGKKRQEQTQIPGTERPDIPEVKDAAEALRIVREERMELTEKEGELASTLRDAMRRNNLMTHTYVDDEGIERTAKREPGEEKVTVRKLKTKAAAEGESSN